MKKSGHRKGYKSKGNKKRSTYAPCPIQPVRLFCMPLTAHWRQSQEDKRRVEKRKSQNIEMKQRRETKIAEKKTVENKRREEKTAVKKTRQNKRREQEMR